MKRLIFLGAFVCLVARAQIPPSVGTLVSTTVILDESQYVGHPCTLYAHNYQNPLTGHLVYCSAIGLNFNISVVGTWAILNTGGGGSVAWGSILGTLSSQTDLQSALNAKQNALTLPLSVANGGTGTTTPALVAGTNVTITGTWPNQTVNSSGGGSGITQLTNDVLSGPGSGSQVATLAAVGSAGSCGDSTHSCQLTFDTKGRETARATVAISGAGTIATGIQTSTFASPPSAAAAGGVFYDTSAASPGLPLYYSTASGTSNYLQWLVLDPGLCWGIGCPGSPGATNVLALDYSIVPRLTNSSDIQASGWRYKAGYAMTGLASAGVTPGSGDYFLYPNSGDGLLHIVNHAGTDNPVGGGSVTTHYGLITNAATAQTIPGTSTPTPVTFDTNTDLTNSAIHSTSSNQQNFVPDATGRWSGACQVTATNDAIDFSVIVYINGVAKFNNGGAHTAGAQNVPWAWSLTSGDIVTCQASSAAGFTVSSIGTTFYGFLVH